MRVRDANSHNILSFSKIQLPASRTRTFCISLLTSCFFASLCSRRSETAGFLLLCRIRSGILCSLSPDLIRLSSLIASGINAGSALVTIPTRYTRPTSSTIKARYCLSTLLKNVTNSQKCLYNNETPLLLSCISLTSGICFYSSGLIFHFPFSIFNFPRGRVRLSCDSLRTVLGRLSFWPT